MIKIKWFTQFLHTMGVLCELGQKNYRRVVFFLGSCSKTNGAC
jgi:hypothetical protein